MDVKRLCVTKNGNKNFYPTPEALAKKMLDKIDFKRVHTVLEPSAGKGDLAMEILKKLNKRYSGNSSDWSVDTIEIDPNLRSILTHRFTEKGIREYEPKLFNELDEMNEHQQEVYRDPEKTKRYYVLMDRTRELDNLENVRVVHDDFLSYRPQFGYDAIIMNPPFDQGVQHLLHAIQLTRHYGGQIVCLLNAETLRNPFARDRKDLIGELEKYDADIEYVSEAFSNAERETDIDIAIVSIKIERKERKSTIFDHLEKAQQVKMKNDHDYAELISTDPIEAAISMYNMEVKAALHLIDEYWAVSDYLNQKFNGQNEDILGLCILRGEQYSDLSIVSYMQRVRLKYWKALLNNKKFMGLLTSNLRSKYQDMVNELANYEFSRYNIARIKREMMAELVDGAKDCIMELFDKLTIEHCYNKTVENGNIHYYNGWRTNKAYKIDKKCIIPTFGIYSQWKNDFDFYATFHLLSDMEKALNYLDGGITEEVNLEAQLKISINSGHTRNIHLKYFDISLYKKGTAHITFRNPELIDRFNIFASQQRGWLPPSYGKKKYKEMSPEEQAVIDSFQGEANYAKVMNNPDRYLFSESKVLCLEAS